MTLITSIAPIPLMTKPHHDRSIILSFTNLETSDLATHASKNFKASNKKTHTSPQKHEPEERTTKRTTKSTNQKNDQKHEPRKGRPKERTRRTSHEKNDQKNEPEKRTTKSTTEKHESKSTNPAPMFQARLTAPLFASPPLKATKYSKRP